MLLQIYIKHHTLSVLTGAILLSVCFEMSVCYLAFLNYIFVFLLICFCIGLHEIHVSIFCWEYTYKHTHSETPVLQHHVDFTEKQ